MKVLVLEVHHPAPGPLLGDDRLANVRLLMEAGLYGLLDGPATAAAGEIRDGFARAGWRIAAIGGAGLAGSAEIRTALVRDDWDFLSIADGPDDDRAFDEDLGALLGLLTGETVILIVSARGEFVLAGPGIPPLGEVEGARPIDLAPTLLTLAGLASPSATSGRPLVSPADVHTLSWDGAVDPAVLERLSGLGYI
jgi:hypothetical protein